MVSVPTKRIRAAGPLKVHPNNPRYFTDASGRAVYLTGSHTWATFQERGIEGATPDFDYNEFLSMMLAMPVRIFLPA